MLRVNLWDIEFSHAEKQLGFDTSCLIKPTKIEYVRNQYEWNGITLFTNRQLHMVQLVKSPIKVAWMIEARAILPQTYEQVQAMENDFDYILTWYEDLHLKNPAKYKLFYNGTTRIPVEERMIYPKTKLCSLLVSKQMTTPSHRFRHQLASFVEQNNLPIDIFGPNHKAYPTKLEAHKDYMFSIVIMNSCENFYFTEYIMDCLMCGTIPVFYGCPAIGQFFNLKGILHFTEFHEILALLKNITPQFYAESMDAIRENFVNAQKYISTDDYVADLLVDLCLKDKQHE
jgi:hypothetical protein